MGGVNGGDPSSKRGFVNPGLPVMGIWGNMSPLGTPVAPLNLVGISTRLPVQVNLLAGGWKLEGGRYGAGGLNFSLFEERGNGRPIGVLRDMLVSRPLEVEGRFANGQSILWRSGFWKSTGTC